MKKDMLGLLLLGGLGIGAYFLFKGSNQAEQTQGGGGANQGAMPLFFPPSTTNIYKTFNYAPVIAAQQQQNQIIPGAQNIPKELFRPYGKKTVTGEIARYTVSRYNVLPGVLHELYLKETQRKFPGWAIWKAR